jgi:hypothetical protein
LLISGEKLNWKELNGMDEAEVVFSLGNIVLPIPAWQIALYVGISGIFMLLQEYKLCLITTYLFAFYWGFYAYGAKFIAVAGGSEIALTFYILSGMLLAVLSLVAFFQERV